MFLLQGMEEILKCFVKQSQPDMTRQIEFIIKQLNSSKWHQMASKNEKVKKKTTDDQQKRKFCVDCWALFVSTNFAPDWKFVNN